MPVHMELLSNALADHVDWRPVPISPQPIIITAIDDRLPDNATTLEIAEGQSFIIEYVDAKTDFSRRRITVWEIMEANGGAPWLHARCHERKAMRSFRVDRIRCCIDHSGKAYDNVPLFLSDSFGLPLSPAGRFSDDEVEPSAWQRVLRAIHHEAVVLSALARADHLLDRQELEAASVYLALEAERRDARVLSGSERDHLIDHVAALRPNGRAIDRALAAVSKNDLKSVQRLLSAAIAVMEADGEQHALEVELINRVATELIGVEVI